MVARIHVRGTRISEGFDQLSLTASLACGLRNSSSLLFTFRMPMAWRLGEALRLRPVSPVNQAAEIARLLA